MKNLSNEETRMNNYNPRLDRWVAMNGVQTINESIIPRYSEAKCIQEPFHHKISAMIKESFLCIMESVGLIGDAVTEVLCEITLLLTVKSVKKGEKIHQIITAKKRSCGCGAKDYKNGFCKYCGGV